VCERSHHIGLPKALLKSFAADENHLDNAEEGLDEEALIDLHLLALRRTIDSTLGRTTLRLPHAGMSEAELAEHKEQNEDILITWESLCMLATGFRLGWGDISSKPRLIIWGLVPD